MLTDTQTTDGSIGAVEHPTPSTVDPLWLQQLLTRMDKYEEMMTLVQTTLAENKILKERIVFLENSLNAQQLPAKPTTESRTIDTTPTSVATASSPKSYASAAANTTTTVATPRRKQHRRIPPARAARLFTDPSPTHGFKFIYLPQKGRVSMSELRRYLSALNIQNGRILDIHFPTRNVCGLLIHKDFEETLITALTKAGVKPLEKFSPEDPDIICDPQYAHATLQQRYNMVMDLQKSRCLRITSRAHSRVQAALAYHFISSGVFTRMELNEWRYPSTESNQGQDNNNNTEHDTHMIETSISEANLPQ